MIINKRTQVISQKNITSEVIEGHILSPFRLKIHLTN
jgi:hypothetical protein